MKTDRHQTSADISIVEVVLTSLETQLQIIRNLKAHSKSTTKQRLAKLERHVALSSQLAEEILEKLVDKQK